MPYVFVRENAIKYWCVVQGLSHNEMSDTEQQTVYEWLAVAQAAMRYSK